MLSTSFDTIDTNIPLVVDLDGTLSKTDTLHEGIISVLFKNPIKIIGMCLALFRGKSYFKEYITQTVTQNADAFCYRYNLIDFLKSESAKVEKYILSQRLTKKLQTQLVSI